MLCEVDERYDLLNESLSGSRHYITSRIGVTLYCGSLFFSCSLYHLWSKWVTSGRHQWPSSGSTFLKNDSIVYSTDISVWGRMAFMLYLLSNVRVCIYARYIWSIHTIHICITNCNYSNILSYILNEQCIYLSLSCFYSLICLRIRVIQRRGDVSIAIKIEEIERKCENSIIEPRHFRVNFHYPRHHSCHKDT